MGAGSCSLYFCCIRRRLSLEKIWKTKFKIVWEPWKGERKMPELNEKGQVVTAPEKSASRF